jgi:hypothetical protein
LEEFIRCAVRAIPLVERAADGDVERRRPRDPGADGGLRPRVQLEPLCLEVVQQLSKELQIVSVAQLRPVLDLDPLAGVLRLDDEALVRAWPDLAPRADADRGVQGLRALVKEIQRPDVERAAGEVYTRGRLSVI